VHVVATFPAGVPDGVEVPPNATVRQFVPHGPVLDRAVCAITHGGMGATCGRWTARCRSAWCPSAATSTRWRWVAVARCGTRLPAAKLTPQRLRAKVFEAMTMTDGRAGWPTAWPPPVAWRTGRI
jgi:UDP:flavonoid glycosyltransferase YjiC (YdhE family)